MSFVSLYLYVPDEGSLLPKYRDCTTYNDFEYIYIYTQSIYIPIYIYQYIYIPIYQYTNIQYTIYQYIYIYIGNSRNFFSVV